jgi:hypothetical protein
MELEQGLLNIISFESVLTVYDSLHQRQSYIFLMNVLFKISQNFVKFLPSFVACN